MAIVSSGQLVIAHIPEYYTFSNVNQLSTLSISQQINNNVVSVEGYYFADDKGGGLFRYSSTSQIEDDGGAIIRPKNIVTNASAGRWIRVFNDNSARVEMWGARGDGRSNDQPSIQKCINYASNNNINYILFDAKTYALSSLAYDNWDINTNNAYPRTFLYLGWGPAPSDIWGGNNNFRPMPVSANNPVNLVFQGAGANLTKLITLSGPNLQWRGYQDGVDYNNSMITFHERVSAFRIYDMTLERQLSAANTAAWHFTWNNIINATTNWGGGNRGPYGFYTSANLNTKIVQFSGVNFVNGHAAFNILRSWRPYGIELLSVRKCNFYYPYGSNSYFTEGGAPMFNMGPEVENSEFIDCWWEGFTERTVAPTNVVNSPNRNCKDGISNFTGVHSLWQNCTGVRTTIENIFAGWNELWWGVNSSQEILIKPQVGGNLVFTISGAGEDYFLKNYTIGTNITLWGGVGSLTCGLGHYRINSITDVTPGVLNLGLNNYTLSCTRVSGADIDDPVGFLNWSEIYLSAGARFNNGGNLQMRKTNYDKTLGVTLSVIDCTFVGGEHLIEDVAYANTYTGGTTAVPFQSPAINLLNGEAIIKNNRFLSPYKIYFANTASTFSVYNRMIFTNNYIEIDNQTPVQLRKTPAFGSYRPPTRSIIDLMGYREIVSNNKFVYWADDILNGNYAQDSAGYPSPSNWYPAITPNTYGQGFNQTIADNIFEINVPLSGEAALPMYSQVGSLDYPDWCSSRPGGFPGGNWCINLSTVRRNNIINYTKVNDLSTLRELRWYKGDYPDPYVTRITYYVLSAVGTLGTFVMSATSTAADNGTTIIRPNFISSGNPGRWIRQ